MESRLLNSQRFEFFKVAWDGENRSGCRPIGDMVLILVDRAAEESKGGIVLTADAVEARQFAAESGTVVAMGGGAFTWNSERSRPWEGEKPNVGDHILFSRYAGRVITGNDGNMYRIMLDKDIGGVATDEGFSITRKSAADIANAVAAAMS